MTAKSRTRIKKQMIANGKGLALPPRNPVALAARQKKAGSHRKSTAAVRQQHARKFARMIREAE